MTENLIISIRINCVFVFQGGDDAKVYYKCTRCQYGYHGKGGAMTCKNCLAKNDPVEVSDIFRFYFHTLLFFFFISDKLYDLNVVENSSKCIL